MIAAGACACAGSWSGGLSSSVIAQGDCRLYGVTQDVLQGWLWGLFGSETGFGVVLPSALAAKRVSVQSERSVGASCPTPKGFEAAEIRICYRFCCFYNGIQLHFEQWALFALRSLHRNPFRCQRDLRNCTETQFAASRAGTPDVFPDVELRSMAEFLLCRLAAFRHLSPSAFLALPFPCRSMWAPPCASAPRTRCPLIPRRGTHRAPRCRGRVDVCPHVVRPGATAHRVVGVAGPVGHGRRGWPRTPAPGHRPCTRPTVVGYDRWPVGRGAHRPAEASRRPPTSKTVHIPTTQVQPRASPK